MHCQAFSYLIVACVATGVSGPGGVTKIAHAVSPEVEIKQRAEREYPNDFAMQKYEVDRQMKAMRALQNYRDHSLPGAVLGQIIADAKREWPTDFSMQKYEIERQSKAYRELHR